MMKTTRLLCLLLTMMSIASAANTEQSQDALHFDELNLPDALDFKHSDPLEAERNDFRLLHFAPMSNMQGERWALVTFKNQSTALRSYKAEHFVVTFANGKQRFAQEIEGKLPGKASKTVAIHFGSSHFPIVSVSMARGW